MAHVSFACPAGLARAQAHVREQHIALLSLQTELHEPKARRKAGSDIGYFVLVELADAAGAGPRGGQEGLQHTPTPTDETLCITLSSVAARRNTPSH